MTVLLVCLISLAIGLSIFYLHYHISVRLLSVRHAVTGEKLPGPPIWFLTGVKLGEFKLTQNHIRFGHYTKQFNKFCQMPLLYQMAVLVSDTKILSEIMANKNFTMRMYPPLFNRFLHNRGILFTNDLEKWKIQRNAALHGIMKNFHLKQVAVCAELSTEKLIQRWISSHSANEKFDVSIDEEFSRLALDVIGQAAFSVDINAVLDDSSPLTGWVQQVMNTVKFIFLPEFVYDIYSPSEFVAGEKALVALRSVVRNILTQRREAQQVGEYHDFLDILLKYQESEEEGKFLSDEDIVYSCWDMFIAGHETTAHTMAWAFYYISELPEVQQRLYEEIQQELGDEAPNFENIKKLNYLHNVIKETLRLRPVIPIFTRISPTEEILGGYRCPPMTPIIIMVSELHKDPDYWDRATEFVPDRWTNIENPDSIPYRPFGYGNRACVGMRMSFVEAKVVMAKLFQSFTFHPASQKIDIEEEYQVTMKPKDLKIAFKRRE